MSDLLNNIPNNKIYAGSAVVSQKPDIKNNAQAPIEKKSFSSKHKTAIMAGATLAGVATVAVLIAKGRFSEAKKLADEIKFQKANTMEEAIAFAKEHLGIKSFDVGGDLEVANYVNEGLVRISNKFKGKADLPTIVQPYPRKLYEEQVKSKGGCVLADICTNKVLGKRTSILRVNTSYFNDVKDKIQECMDLMRIKIAKRPDKLYDIKFRTFPFMDMKKQEKLIPLLIKINEKTASKMEILQAKQSLGDMLCYADILYKQPEKIYEEVLASDKLKKIILKKTGAEAKSMEEFNKLNKDEKVDYLHKLNDKILENEKNKEIFSVFSDIHILNRKPDVFQLIYHEVGHSMHIKNIGKAQQKKYRDAALFDNNADEKWIANTISNYAATKPSEFVAEVFAELVAGHPVTDKVMNLYKKYGGHEVPMAA